MAILLVGTLDTKGAEYAYVRDLIAARGHELLVMDAGVLGTPSFEPDVGAAEVAAAGGGSLAALRAAGDRGAAMDVMERGLVALARQAHEEGRVDGVLALGGSGGTALATAVMRALPIGLPKLMLSTVASGDTRPYVGVRDITMMYSVVDIAGLNRLSRRILANGAGAICGMVEQPVEEAEARPLVAATMFGVTTPAVTAVRERLEAAGYEVLVFHATGSGGQAMEALIEDGYVGAVADLTTTEWCDELVGGVLSAGPTRLEAAARAGIPQVVSVGALDMVNWWAPESVPQAFRERTLYRHNANVTLMRTTAEEMASLGRILAEKLNQARGPTVLVLPLGGVSALDQPGQPFHDPAANEALFATLRREIRPPVTLLELEAHINDPEFAESVADQLLRLMEAR